MQSDARLYQRKYLPNLNVLRVFEAAGRHLSFKRAAHELCVTPSAVSQQIKILESQLGVALFKRNNRALALTATGETYWLAVHHSIESIHHATKALVHPHQEELTVSLMPPVANRVVLPNLPSFQNANPHIHLRIDASQKARNVMKGEVDLAVRFGSPPWEGVACEKLCDLYIQVVCPPGFTRQYHLDESP